MEALNSCRLRFGRLCAGAALAMLASNSFAQTYSVEIRPALNDLDVKVEHVELTGMLIMKLTNNTQQKVRCELRYDASPQLLHRASVFIDPGKTEQNAFRQTQTWFSVTVDVECKPTGKK